RVFFFTDSTSSLIYTLSLHDALPICLPIRRGSFLCNDERFSPSDDPAHHAVQWVLEMADPALFQARHRPNKEAVFLRIHFQERGDRKSTRLNSSHVKISYAVFCLKKK